jgi:hypothetical protein
MSTICKQIPHYIPMACVSVAISLLLCMRAGAQAEVGSAPLAGASTSVQPVQSSRPDSSEQASLLPNAPGSFDASLSSETTGEHVSSASDFGARGVAVGVGASLPEATRTQKYIKPGQTVPVLTADDKVLLGVRNAFAPYSVFGWFASAGYEQMTNSSPNDGTDRGAFGQRLGAAALLNTSEDILSDSVMANFLHEDPRYYRMGPMHNVFVRIAYSGTRPIITRTDAGRTSLNLSFLAGNMGGAALTNLYYPSVNCGGVQTMETFGGSLIQSVAGNVLSEFYGDFKHLLRPRHN